MTLYLLVSILLPICAPVSGIGLDDSRTKICANVVYKAPDVSFFLSQANAAKEYAAAPKGSARLFKIGFRWALMSNDGCIGRPESVCYTIKELNVLPAQSYEVSDKASVEAKP